MLLFDPSTHEHFQSVDAFIKHICTSGQELDKRLAMVEAWRKASVRLHLDELMGSVRRGERGAGSLRKRCSDTVGRILDVWLLFDALNRRLLEAHGMDPEAWFQCRRAPEAASTLQ